VRKEKKKSSPNTGRYQKQEKIPEKPFIHVLTLIHGKNHPSPPSLAYHPYLP
jgi:hypothetical protein